MPEDERYGPSEIPIGRAFTILPGLLNDDIRSAIEAIDHVHGDGDLQPTPIRLAQLTGDSRRRRRGRIVLHAETGDPVAVLIDPNETHRAFTTVHEIGHILDLAGIGDMGVFSSIREVKFAQWRRLVRRTQAVEELGRISQVSSLDIVGVDGVVRSVEVDSRFAEELLMIEELWARSYAQFIAIRSNNPLLRRALDAHRERSLGQVYYPLQWDDDDFDAVDHAIESLMRRLQWRAPRNR